MASRTPENSSNEGTVDVLSERPGCSFILDEAECSDDSDDEPDDDLDALMAEDFVDNAFVAQGDSLSLFNAQTVEEHEIELQSLKRKFIGSPLQVQQDVKELSPRLANVSLEESRGKRARKQLFLSDSGIDSADVTAEPSTLDTDATQIESTPLPPNQPRFSDKDLDAIFKNKNRQYHMLTRFKQTFGVNFNDITRPFKNSRTTSGLWVVAMFYQALDSEITTMEVLLQSQCSYFYLENTDGIILLFAEFHVQKSRITIINFFNQHFYYNENRIMADPPKVRNVPAALFFFQRFVGTNSHGQIPDFITQQVSIQGQTQQFDFSRMVQWALDHDYIDEPQIALEYAMLAETDDNARAFLKLTSQPKIVKDCGTMVRMYKTALMNRMSMSQYIRSRCDLYGEPEPELWRRIVHFVRYQGQDFLPFMQTMLNFLHHKPKKCTMVFCGPPDTGKTYFASSLNSFLGGSVLSFCNFNTHFWLSPMRNARVCFIDDATPQFWRYADTYLRTALDGHMISVDAKHKNAVQLRAPPLIITTNENIKEQDEFKYLQTRCSYLYFNKQFPVKGDGSPLYPIDGATWTSFFNRFWRHLNLTDPDDESDGEAPTTIRLYTGRDSDTV
ncbi:E1 protein [Eumops bonariensis papillomavirus type 1]|nr:E1 protein [Eumops bonariensis papillomavirus type 1]